MNEEQLNEIIRERVEPVPNGTASRFGIRLRGTSIERSISILDSNYTEIRRMVTEMLEEEQGYNLHP